MAQQMQPQVILLKEGTDSSQGKPQLISNINACAAVADVIRSTLGPRGMDKLIYDQNKATISNDGATILKLLEVVHPAASCLVDIAKSQDNEVGDGTTSVVVLASEFLRECKQFIEDGVHPQILIKSIRTASQLAIERLNEWAIDITGKDAAEHRQLLERCAATALNSKLMSYQKGFFAPMVVDAVLSLDDDLDLGMIGIKKVPGGATEESFLVKGVAFKKTFAYAGFEQQPKKIPNPSIALLNIELELKSEKENAEVRITDPAMYQSIVDAEWSIIFGKLDRLVEAGCTVVLSKLPIGDLATQYFADRNIFCAGRVPEEDLSRVAKATGGMMQTSVNNIIPEVLGKCELMEEVQVGGERYNIFSGCPQAKTATIVLRGGAEQYIEESHRSIHDSIMVVRRAVKHSRVVPGGGAIEMELSKSLREYSRTIHGKSQLIINAFAKALEIVPRQISDNAGFDSTDILNKLRQKHALGGRWFGVDIANEGICDTYESYVWEPVVIKLNAISAAAEAACLVLSIDETVRNPASEKPNPGPRMPPGGMGRGGMGGMGRGVKMLKGRGGK